MKARDHDKIMRESERSIVAMRNRHHAELAHQKEFFDWEVAHRERIMNRYADALGRQDATIAILGKLLAEHGVDYEAQAQIIDAELAKLEEDDEVQS